MVIKTWIKQMMSVKTKATQMQTGQMTWGIRNPPGHIHLFASAVLKSSKQSCVTQSTAEAEYVALSATAQKSV